MSTAHENGFDGSLPSSIKPDGFHCYRRGGCDREALCEGERECLGADPRPANALNHNHLEIERLSVDPPMTNALGRNRFDEIAELIRGLTYAEMVELASSLWRLRGDGKLNGETLPQILYAWASKMELASDCAVHNEPAPPVEERRKFRPIDTAPKDRPILAFMLGAWRIARWKPNHPHKRPIPFWSADDLRVSVSRAHQPKWWTQLPPPPPPEAEA